MDYNKQIHHRKSIRLNEYDYSQQGAYFITICTKNQKHLFGKIISGKMELNNAGKMIQTIWNELPTRFDNIILDESIIMPNHTHGIIIITPNPQEHPHMDKPYTNPYKQNKDKNTSPDISKPSTGEPCVRPHTTQYSSPNTTQYIPQNPPETSPKTNKKYTDYNYTQNIHSEKNHTGNTQTKGDHKDRPYGTLTGSLGRVIQAFKSITTHKYTINVKQNGWVPFSGKLWHRNYWEHIVRDENELNRIRQYIQNNPEKWQNDKLNYKNGNIAKEDSPLYGEEIWMV